MKAAIVGCGIGGMASAIALSRRGVDVTLFEAFQTPRPMGSGLLLQPSGLAALGVLGLDEAARATGAVVTRLDGRDLAGRRILELDYSAWRKGAFGIGIHRASLFDILLGATRRSGAKLVTGARIASLGDPAAPVLITEGGARHGPFDLVVVADGSASVLRDQVCSKARAPVYPWGAVWANCPDADGRFQGALSQRYRAAGIMIGVLPIGGGQVSLFWSVPVAEHDAFFAGDLAAWRDEVGSLWPQTRPLLDTITSKDQLSRAVYRDVAVGGWNRGRCIVIGDAAHGTSPQLGQGANLALIDAVELADRLEDGLTRYQAARRRHTGFYQAASRALTPMFQSKGWFWPLVRDYLCAPCSRLWPFRKLAATVLVGMARLGPTPHNLRP